MIDIFRNNPGVFLPVVVAVFGLLHLVISKEHKNFIKERIDEFISWDYTELPKTLAKYALNFIDHVFGLKGDYLPRAFQILHIGICISALAFFLGISFFSIHYPNLFWISLDLLFIIVLIPFLVINDTFPSI
jgi:hypothetical protein